MDGWIDCSKDEILKTQHMIQFRGEGSRGVPPSDIIYKVFFLLSKICDLRKMEDMDAISHLYAFKK